MKVIWRKSVIAEAPTDQLVKIEDEWYFPPKYLEWQYFEESSYIGAPTWQGEPNYYNVVVDGQVNELAAVYYPEPKAKAIDRTGVNFANFVTFRGGIEVVE